MIRTASPADLHAVHALLNRWAEQTDEPSFPLGLLESEWATPGFDTQRDHWLDEADGETVGYAALKPGGGVTARGGVTELLPLVETRARERGDDELEAIATTRAEDVIAAYSAAGWERPRDVYRMWLQLAEPSPEPRFPPDVSVRTYRDADARPLHAFLTLAYAQNNERVDAFEPWLHFMTAEPSFDPAYWHLAESGGELVACALTWALHEGRGWIKDLAVHPEHRRRGLGEALLHRAHEAYRAAGAGRVGLKVDSDNPTGAPRLYERLGYVTDRTYAIFTKRP
jgi:ribosomal protein S18 acetylase RimI-like enzyme